MAVQGNPNLFNCSVCGHLIAGQAPRCVGCGTPGDIARSDGTLSGRTPEPAARSPLPRGALVEDLPSRLEKLLTEILQPGEIVQVKLKGAFKEGLVCTDRRVIILKAGLMVGVAFGSNVFQLPYRSITGAQVKKHLLTGYFEVSAGGVQNTPTSYWPRGSRGAERRENCVALNQADSFPKFQQASTFIMSRCGSA